MSERRPFKEIAFMVVWMVFWTAAILIALYTFGAAALAGDLMAALFLMVWIAVALFALYRAGMRLLHLMVGQSRSGRPIGRAHKWNDGIASETLNANEAGGISPTEHAPTEQSVDTSAGRDSRA